MLEPDLAALLPSWELALRSERKAAGTIKAYRDGVIAYLRWCETNSTPAVLGRTATQVFVAHLLDAGAEAATVYSRLKGLRRFSAWLAEEGEIASDPLAGMRSPRIDAKVVRALSEDELKRLFKACRQGPDGPP